MARKPKAKEPSPESESNDDQGNETLTEPPLEINPYKVLSLDRSATADQIKSAYRKAALKHHPDKAMPEQKDEAHKKFQDIAFAYAILSDEKRRRRYDTTGSTGETLEDDDFDWIDFFREQTQAMVSGDMIEQIKKDYQGSEEEKKDVLRVYEEYEGDMDMVYEEVMCSNVLDDDNRFRKIIDEAIAVGDVQTHHKYTKESGAKRKKRLQHAKAEAAEAMELAEELGVKDKLFGKRSGNSKAGKKSNDEEALKALIQQRQKGRAESLFVNLEAKYGGGGGGNKSKRKVDEPPEELFQKNAKKAKSRIR
ncbi:hypothetical protein H2198_008216 [Neophaeococcomyces mojaviensis]|uniref:Uncharacterized protein n=1 Tax=Neophaeococcomyces mojaviensis TaxID=3383035 RepID=A0ACC2ZY34_9EURO|nr:hypothetical protein H2198_008216 [Knufia sp. JES_112]